MNFKRVAKNLLKRMKFTPVHIGVYIRRLHFWRAVAGLPIERFQKVLDAGCGYGHYASEFAQKFPQIEVHGIDIILPGLERSLPPNCQLCQVDLLNLKRSRQYDFIWCIDVLEHVPDNGRALINLIAALRYGGFLYLHVPYDSLEKRIFPESWFAGFNKWAENEHIGKQRPLDEWTAILRKAGLEIRYAQWTFGFWGELAWEIDRLTDGKLVLKAMLSPVLRAMAHLALRQGGSNRRGNVLLVGQKLSGDMTISVIHGPV